MPTLDDFHAIEDFRQEGLGFTATCPACTSGKLSLQIAVWGKQQKLEYACATGCRPGTIDVAIARLNRPEPVKAEPTITTSPAAPAQVAPRPEAPAPGVPKLYAKLLSFAQLRALPPPIEQIEELIFEKSFIEICGAPNAGKSFIALDMAKALTIGGDWRGREILLPGPCLYVNADGGPGFSKRANAWAAAHNDPDATFEFWTLPNPVMLHDINEMLEFKALLAYLPDQPVMVVFDTYSQCIAGMNENLQECASLVVDQINDIRAKIGCTVVLVHHLNATGQRDRGSTVITGACDTIIRVDQDESTRIITASCKKQRDAEWFKPMTFRLEPVDAEGHVWLEQFQDETQQTPQDRAQTEQIINYIKRNPGHTTDDIFRNTQIKGPEIKLVVSQLLLDGQVEELFTPREPGQRGAASKGLRWAA